MNFLTSDFPTSNFFSSLTLIHSPLFPRPHLIIGAPDLRSERAVRQKTSCLIRQLTESYLSFSEQAAVGSMRRCSLDFFLHTFLHQGKKVCGVWGKAPRING
jgi:hypothetical protein